MTTNGIVAEALGSRPRPLNDIALETGLSRRDVEQAIHELRLGGAPICTGQAGAWVAQSAAELAASNGRLHHRLREQYATLKAQRRTEAMMRDAETRPLVLFSEVA